MSELYTKYATEQYVKSAANTALNSAKEYADTITAGLATEEYVEEAVSSLDTIIAVDENRDGNIELRQYLDGANELPEATVEDEGKFLRVVNGVPTWVSLASAEEASF